MTAIAGETGALVAPMDATWSSEPLGPGWERVELSADLETRSW